MSKRIYPVTVKDGELVEVDEKLTVNGLPISKNGTIDAADVSGDVGGGAFEDTDGDDVAELQTAHASAEGGDIRNVGAFDADEQSISNLGGRVYATTAQTISDTTVTKVQFDTVAFDDRGEFDDTNDKIVASVDGTYYITAVTSYNSPPDATWIQGQIAKNGTKKVANNSHTGLQQNITAQVDTILDLTSGDDITVKTYQNSGAGQDTLAGEATVAVAWGQIA